MQAKQYLKNIAKAVLSPVVKSLGGSFPNYGAGLSLISQRVFSWGADNMQAYGNKIFYSATNILVLKLTEVPITFNQKKTKVKDLKFIG